MALWRQRRQRNRPASHRHRQREQQRPCDPYAPHVPQGPRQAARLARQRRGELCPIRVPQFGRSEIRAFDLTNLTSTSPAYNFNADGLILSWGLRNSVGVGEHPLTGDIYAVENSVDGVKRNGKDVHENNPGEELNFFGYLNGTATASQGRNFGYPHCFAVWEVSEIPDNDGLGIGKQFAFQGNTTLRDETCAERYIPPRLTFPANYAPMDIKLSEGGERRV
ncbi:hypothetical protein VTI74DRAFT_4073 [Chaetomium olivicolor]